MRRLKLIALACTAGLLTLAAADLALRFAVNSPVYMMAHSAIPAVTRYNANATSDEMIVGDLGRTTAVISDDEPRRVRIAIDAFGFRNDGDAAGSAADVVLLGDSFGFGVGTTQDRTLAARWRERFGLAVYNLSMPWTGPRAHYLNLALESDRLPMREGATVVWLMFSGNDLDDRFGELNLDRIPRNGAAGQVWMSLRRLRNRSPIYRRLRQVTRTVIETEPDGPVTVVTPATFVNGRAMLFLKPYADVRRRTAADVIAHPNAAALRRTIAATAQLAARLKVSLKVVMAPTKEEVYGWVLDGGEPWSTPAVTSGLAKVVGDMCAEAGLEFLDLKPAFVDESRALFERSGEVLWWYDDSHWNERGHDLAASVIHAAFLAHPGGAVRRSR